MKRFHARVAVVQALKDLGLYVETKDNPMQIPICRCVQVAIVDRSPAHVETANPVTSSSPS